MKILTTNEVLELARRAKLEDYSRHELALINAQNELAVAVAGHLNVFAGDTTSEELELYGLCSSFGPKNPEDACPSEFEGLDDGGDWDLADIYNN